MSAAKRTVDTVHAPQERTNAQINCSEMAQFPSKICGFLEQGFHLFVDILHSSNEKETVKNKNSSTVVVFLCRYFY